MPIRNETELLRDASATIQEIKAFERDLGLEPTQALAQTSQQRTPTSMLWFWLQRAGTLALRDPIDVRLTLGFAKTKEEVPLDQVYRVDGYSVYYRQGNEFADPRSVATESFAREGAVRQVTVVIHEDLHGDSNFDLPWEIEESLITPLGSIAAVEFFKRRSDSANLERAQERLDDERQLSRELGQLVTAAEAIFSNESVENAKQKIVAMIPSYPVYHRHFQRQIRGQHPETAIEAKLSHDMAYYRHFDRIVALYETTQDLEALVRNLRKAPRDAQAVTAYLQSLRPSDAVATLDSATGGDQSSTADTRIYGFGDISEMGQAQGSWRKTHR
ncbi:MAG TPA: hypothetical protein VFS81_11975 [Candidatus Binatia bacterium]|nr:hypothetical protein [Candidatus Binatia bacterium]